MGLLPLSARTLDTRTPILNPRVGAGVAAALIGIAVLLFGLGGRGPSFRVGPTQAVSDDPQLAINVNTSPVAAADPRRPAVIAVASRVDAPRLACKVAVSLTAGDAWRPLDLPLAPAATNCFWPSVAFDGEGNLLVLYTPTGGEFNLPLGLWLQRFTGDLTATGAPTQVSGPLTFEPRLAVAGRRVLVAWIAVTDVRLTKALGFGPPPNPIVVARSDDGGQSFGAPVTVSDAGRLAVQPTLIAGPGEEVFVGALDLGQDRATYESSDLGLPGPPPAQPWSTVIWRSTDGGASFGPPTTVAPVIVASQRVLIDLAPAPAFAADPVRKRLYSAWESAGDVFLARSTDSGASWSAPLRLGPTDGKQFLPGIGIAPDGRVDVAFYDRSRDPDDVQAEMVLASSADGGQSFTTTTVSNQPFDSLVGSFNGEDVALGSHVAVVAQAGRTTIVWPDGGRGNPVNNIVDLATATVEITSGRGARVPVAMAGGMLAVIGLGFTALSWPGSAPRRGQSPGRPR